MATSISHHVFVIAQIAKAFHADWDAKLDEATDNVIVQRGGKRFDITRAEIDDNLHYNKTAAMCLKKDHPFVTAEVKA